MTIMIISYTPKEILFASDTFRYFLKEGTVEDVLDHRLEIDHTNLKEHIEHHETNCPKIHKITKNTAVIYGGDGRFSHIPEGLNKRKNIAKQVMERLQEKGTIKAFWSCHIGTLHNGKITLTSIIYESGKITTKEHTDDNITFDSFAPEMQKRFPFQIFYMANTEQKIQIINEFFKQTTKLYGGLAGGTAEIAILNEKGFQWIRTQNFTTSSLVWKPEKLETIATTQYAWSSTDWTDVLSLQFECESTMLLFIFGYAYFEYVNNESQNIKGASFRLLIDDTPLTGTMGETSGIVPASGLLYGTYHIHTVSAKEKGIHTLKLQTRALTTYNTVGVYDRRLSIIKSFYQGGAT